jgi:hypothetical protein
MGKGRELERALFEDKKVVFATTITGVRVGERKGYFLRTGSTGSYFIRGQAMDTYIESMVYAYLYTT